VKSSHFTEAQFPKSRFPSAVLETQDESASGTKGKLKTNQECVLLLQPDVQPHLPAQPARKTIHSITLSLAMMKSQNFVIISKEL